MFRRSLAVLALVPIVATAVSAADALRALPKPVADYARQFEAECQSGGLGQLILSENYRQLLPGRSDINGDSKPDYVVYKCMFGCSAKPTAFEGLATPCAWGNLLLSGKGKHTSIFLPGLISRIEPGPPIRIAVARPRALSLSGNFCEEGFPGSSQQQVFEFRDGRFKLVGMCGENGCTSLLERRAAMPAR